MLSRNGRVETKSIVHLGAQEIEGEIVQLLFGQSRAGEAFLKTPSGFNVLDRNLQPFGLVERCSTSSNAR